MNQVRLLVVEDHIAVRLGLRTLVDLEPDLTMAGEAVDGLDAVSKFRELRPDVVLMDLHLPHLNGVEATARIRSEFQDACILVWAMSAREEDIAAALEAGACACVLKTAERTELFRAIYDAVRAHRENTGGRLEGLFPDTNCQVRDTKVSATKLPSCD